MKPVYSRKHLSQHFNPIDLGLQRDSYFQYWFGQCISMFEESKENTVSTTSLHFYTDELVMCPQWFYNTTLSAQNHIHVCYESYFIQIWYYTNFIHKHIEYFVAFLHFTVSVYAEQQMNIQTDSFCHICFSWQPLMQLILIQQ